MKTVLLDSALHDRNRFSCGIAPLDNYLKVKASQQSRKGNSRTFVLEAEANTSYIIGFYTLTMTPIDLNALPEKLQKKHASATSGALIARLAVDQRYHGCGLGEWLLIDALKKLLQASDTVAFPVVIVDAKDGARQFYETYGFTAFQNAADRLFIAVADVRESLRA